MSRSTWCLVVVVACLASLASANSDSFPSLAENLQQAGALGYTLRYIETRQHQQQHDSQASYEELSKLERVSLATGLQMSLVMRKSDETGKWSQAQKHFKIPKTGLDSSQAEMAHYRVWSENNVKHCDANREPKPLFAGLERSVTITTTANHHQEVRVTGLGALLMNLADMKPDCTKTQSGLVVCRAQFETCCGLQVHVEFNDANTPANLKLDLNNGFKVRVCSLNVDTCDDKTSLVRYDVTKVVLDSSSRANKFQLPAECDGVN